MRTFQNRVAVITGGGSGIGRATARHLAERGCDLALVDRYVDGMAETAALVAEEGRRATCHEADVTDVDRMAALPAEVVAEHDKVNILINNAGVTSAGNFEDESLEDLRWIIDINVWGVLYGCKFFLPVLRDAEEGHIVNLSSMVGLLGMPSNASYSLTKGAIRSFTESLRSELIGTSIGVTSVHPGAINTPLMNAAGGADGERLKKMASSKLAPIVMRPPSAVAKKIVRAIEKNQARTLVGPDARLLDLAARILPGRSGLVGRVTN